MLSKLVIVAFITIVEAVSAQVITEVRQFYSPSLNQSRTVIVHKPTSISTESPCPVFIFLPGWGNQPAEYNYFNSVMSNLLNSGTINPMLIVVPDGSGGIYTASGYWNSEANGRYGDYIVQDLVDWVSQEYPVKNDSLNRHDRLYWLIGGFSMGGGGSARLALAYPNLFSGFASFSGGLEFDYFNDWFEQANIENPDYIYSPPNSNQLYTWGIWANASIFSPDTTVLYNVQFPLQEGTGQVVDSVFTKWLLDNPRSLARDYFLGNNQPADSMKIYIRVGSNEPYAGNYRASKQFSDTLNAWGISHNYGEHLLGHDFNSTLVPSLLMWADSVFSRSITIVEGSQLKVNEFELQQNFPNPFNPSTTIKYSIPTSNFVTIKVYDVLGNEVAALVNEEKPAGTY
ncbi:MAG TPA: alpha/beta hydrolase-fold protein, partial [Ignavibacteriaceae bacterium]|nr:alpha/beta hydrolase-fold protein [Ignavibacteriaceae bacterium]